MSHSLFSTQTTNMSRPFSHYVRSSCLYLSFVLYILTLLTEPEMYFVNSQGLLFFYWSLILFSSSWSLSPVWWKNQKIIIGTKISCFALPAIQLGLLRLESLRDNDLAQLILMNCISKYISSHFIQKGISLLITTPESPCKHRHGICLFGSHPCPRYYHSPPSKRSHRGPPLPHL